MAASKYWVILLVLVLNNLTLKAHFGGHFQQTDLKYLNSWQLKDGRQVNGNFLMSRGDTICLEQESGKLLKLDIGDFSISSRRVLDFSRKRYRLLNQESNILTRQNSLLTSVFPLLLIVFVFLAVVQLIIRNRKEGILFNIAHYAEQRFHFTSVLIVLACFILIVQACKKSTQQSVTDWTVIPKSRTGFIDSAFAPFKPAVTTRWDDTYFYVSSSGIPQHNMMVGIKSWQQQVPIPQAYTGSNSWSIPLQPQFAAQPLSTKTNLMKGAVAIAVNGIPIFNALNNRGADSYATGELDLWGGHCGRADDYHYHAAPLHLAGASGQLPIAFALDGFAVYGTNEPDGSTMKELDTCHGHALVPGYYHYHGTLTYPYVVGAMRGKVTLDPSTPAPENQILPQAFAAPVRPALTPLSGAIISAFEATGPTAYKLTYQQGSKAGYVEYGWNLSNLYTFRITDTSGTVQVNSYQRK